MLLDKVKETIACYNMLEKGDRVVVGVSGGPDSIALLYILNILSREFKIRLFIAHLNHMIRKKAAREDALFVKKTAEKLNLPVIIESEDVPKLAKESKFSIEEAARNARYDFYLRTANKFKANKIALGHTGDDQAETVLMRLLRGSGLLGLSGIPPIRKFENKTIIKPLIEVSKKEIIKFLAKRKIPFRQDITNIQPIYLRNRIRNKLLPFLEKEFNPGAKKVLNEIARNVRIDYNCLLKIAEKKFKQYAKCSKDKAKVNLRFLDEELAIQRMIIREAIRKVKGNLNSITYAHWEDINALLRTRSRWSLNLPAQVLIKRTGNNLVLSREPPREKIDLTKTFYELKIPGKIKIPEIGKVLQADFIKMPVDFKSSATKIGGSAMGCTEVGFRRKKSKREEYFDFDRLKLPLFVRFKKSGDRIIPLGMVKYKRLKQLFIDEKVPFEKRDHVPLIISGDEIIWICGIKRSNYARVVERTEKVVRLKIE